MLPRATTESWRPACIMTSNNWLPHSVRPTYVNSVLPRGRLPLLGMFALLAAGCAVDINDGYTVRDELPDAAPGDAGVTRPDDSGTDSPAPIVQCDNARVIPSESQVHTAELSTSDPITYAPTCGGIGATVLFRWLVPRTDSFVIDTADSDFDTVLFALNADCSAELACNDDTGTMVTSSFDGDFVQDDVIYFGVTAESPDNAGTIQLSIKTKCEQCLNLCATEIEACCQPRVNDECTGNCISGGPAGSRGELNCMLDCAGPEDDDSFVSTCGGECGTGSARIEEPTTAIFSCLQTNCADACW